MKLNFPRKKLECTKILDFIDFMSQHLCVTVQSWGGEGESIKQIIIYHTEISNLKINKVEYGIQRVDSLTAKLTFE